jgi:hypothetical protein
MVTVTNWDSKLNQLLGNIRDALAQLAFTNVEVTNFDSKTELLLAEIRNLIEAGGGGGDITGNGAATQVAVFDAAKNIIGYVPLKFLKAASLANREILQIGTPGTNNSSPGVLKLINPTTNTNNQSAAILIEHTDGTSEFSIVQFAKNASVGDGLNGHFEFSATKRRGSVYFVNTNYPLCFFAPEINFGVRTFDDNSIGMRLITSLGLRLGLVEDIKGDTITPTAVLDLSGKNLTKAALRLRPQTATTSNIEAGNLEFNGSRLLLSLGTTEPEKKELAYTSDFQSGSYTPTANGKFTVGSDWTFIRIGNIVQLSGRATYAPGVGAEGEISVPGFTGYTGISLISGAISTDAATLQSALVSGGSINAISVSGLTANCQIDFSVQYKLEL